METIKTSNPYLCLAHGSMTLSALDLTNWVLKHSHREHIDDRKHDNQLQKIIKKFIIFQEYKVFFPSIL